MSETTCSAYTEYFDGKLYSWLCISAEGLCLTVRLDIGSAQSLITDLNQVIKAIKKSEDL